MVTKLRFFEESIFGFSKMDKNKCPKMKSQNTFPKKGLKITATCGGTLFRQFGGQVLHGCRENWLPGFKPLWNNIYFST